MKIELPQIVVAAQAEALRALDVVQKIDAAIEANRDQAARAKSDLEALKIERDAWESERVIEADEKAAVALEKKVMAISKSIVDQTEHVARLERIHDALLAKGREHDGQIASAKARLGAALAEFNVIACKQLTTEMRLALAPYMQLLRKALAVSDALGESSIWRAISQTTIADPSDSMRPIIDGNRLNNADGSHTELGQAWRADGEAMVVFEALKKPKATLSKFSGHKPIDERLAVSAPYVLKGYEIRGFNRPIPKPESPEPSLVGRLS